MAQQQSRQVNKQQTTARVVVGGKCNQERRAGPVHRADPCHVTVGATPQASACKGAQVSLNHHMNHVSSSGLTSRGVLRLQTPPPNGSAARQPTPGTTCHLSKTTVASPLRQAPSTKPVVGFAQEDQRCKQAATRAPTAAHQHHRLWTWHNLCYHHCTTHACTTPCNASNPRDSPASQRRHTAVPCGATHPGRNMPAIKPQHLALPQHEYLHAGTVWYLSGRPLPFPRAATSLVKRRGGSLPLHAPKRARPKPSLPPPAPRWRPWSELFPNDERWRRLPPARHATRSTQCTRQGVLCQSLQLAHVPQRVFGSLETRS